MHTSTDSKNFKIIVNYFFEDYYANNPEEATSLGLTRHGNELKNFSDDHMTQEESQVKGHLRQLTTINSNNLSIDEQIDYDILKNRLELFLFLRKNIPDTRQKNINQYTEITSLVHLLKNDIKLTLKAELILGRLELFPFRMSQGKEYLEKPPSLWIENALLNIPFQVQFIKNLTTFEFFKTHLSEANHKKLFLAIDQAVEAYQDFSNFLPTLTDKNQSDESFAIGQQAFEKILEKEHFIPYTTNELLAMAEHKFNTTQEELKQLSHKIAPNKDLYDILKKLKSETVKKDELLGRYTEAVSTLKTQLLDQDICTLPTENNLEVVYTPDYFRSIIPFAAYSSIGPFAKGQTYEFWVTPIHNNNPAIEKELLESHCTSTIKIIAAHECYPGHHLQISLANSLKTGTTVRRSSFNTTFIEGWALYCEQLLGEHGFYNEKEYFMMLYNRLWRILRIILDVKLHTGQINFPEAVRAMNEKLHMPLPQAEAEVIRYTMSPTQPSSYELGRHLINDIRDSEQMRLGHTFHLKEFHNKLLSFGSISPALMQKYFNAHVHSIY